MVQISRKYCPFNSVFFLSNKISQLTKQACAVNRKLSLKEYILKYVSNFEKLVRLNVSVLSEIHDSICSQVIVDATDEYRCVKFIFLL